jgi:hypothetical protein
MEEVRGSSPLSSTIQAASQAALRDRVGSDEGVRVAVADDLQVVGGPAAGEHGVQIGGRPSTASRSR